MNVEMVYVFVDADGGIGKGKIYEETFSTKKVEGCNERFEKMKKKTGKNVFVTSFYVE